jgi:hypothetical protein
MDIATYLAEIRTLSNSGQATEHSYRPALERLFRSIDDNLTVINEPKQSAVGAPSFELIRSGLECHQTVDEHVSIGYQAEQLQNINVKAVL